MSMMLTPFGWQFVQVNGAQIIKPSTARRSVVPWYPNVNVQKHTEPTPSSEPNTISEFTAAPEKCVTPTIMEQGLASRSGAGTEGAEIKTEIKNVLPALPVSILELTTAPIVVSANVNASTHKERPKRVKVRRIGSIRCSKCNKFGLRTECCADALYFVVVRSKFIPKQIQSGIGRRSFHSFKEADVFRRCVAQRVKQRRQDRRLTEEQSLKRKERDMQHHHQQQQQHRQLQPQAKRKRLDKVKV